MGLSTSSSTMLILEPKGNPNYGQNHRSFCVVGVSSHCFRILSKSTNDWLSKGAPRTDGQKTIKMSQI